MRSVFDVAGTMVTTGRSLAMMALVTECHPFDDGNGRMARIMANAELSAAGELRIVIPTISRGDYLSAWNGFSNQAGRGASLVAVLRFAQQWVAAVDWSTFEQGHATMTAAYLEIEKWPGRRL